MGVGMKGGRVQDLDRKSPLILMCGAIDAANIAVPSLLYFFFCC